MIPSKAWGMFDAVTGDSPMLTDIADWMLKPYCDADRARHATARAEHALATERGMEIIVEVEPCA